MLTKQSYLLYNPASELELPKFEKRLPRAVLTASEAESVLNNETRSELVSGADEGVLFLSKLGQAIRKGTTGEA